MLNYTFHTPRSQLRKGYVYKGSEVRLRRAVSKLMGSSAGTFKLGLVGGSISFGDMATKRSQTDFFGVLSAWITAAFPNVVTRNGAVPATPSNFMVLWWVGGMKGGGMN